MQLLDGRQYELPCDGEVCYPEPYDNWKNLLDSCRMFPDKIYMHNVSHPNDDDTVMYDLASFLLAAGPSSYIGFRETTGLYPRYHPFLDICVGAPQGEPQEVAYRTFHRSFEYAEVYLNADPNNDATVQIPPELQDVFGVPVPSGPRELGPWQGLVLLSPSGEVVPPQVKIDLLGGIGDFEYCADTSWNVYGHPDYDFDSETGWVGDYRSTISMESDVVARVGGSGAGDSVTIKSVRSTDSEVSEVTYEFTDGQGARAGNVEVNVGADRSPINAALSLTDAVEQHQGSQGSGAAGVSCDGGVVYVKPNLHWELKTFADSDTSDARIACTFPTWRYGFNEATPDDSVAVGWTRQSGTTVNPGSNVVYRISEGTGIGGGKCQYFALKDYSGSFGSAYLTASFKVSDKPSNLHVGDHITFKVDHIRMSDYDLGAGATVTYKLRIQWGGQWFEEAITKSDEAFSAQISAGPIPSGITVVSAGIRIDVTGNIGQKEPGVYADGAHLFVKRAENPTQYATWEVPVSRNRSIETMLYTSNFDSRHDVFEVACKYDSVVLGERYGKSAARLKYLSPEIKLYIYESVTSTDFRDSRGIDLSLIHI